MLSCYLGELTIHVRDRQLSSQDQTVSDRPFNLICCHMTSHVTRVFSQDYLSNHPVTVTNWMSMGHRVPVNVLINQCLYKNDCRLVIFSKVCPDFNRQIKTHTKTFVRPQLPIELRSYVCVV